MVKNLTLEEGNSLYVTELQKLCDMSKKWTVQLFMQGPVEQVAALLLKFKRTKDVEIKDGYIQFTTYDNNKESIVANTEQLVKTNFPEAVISNIIANEVSAGE